jgi:hypothetical protein
MQIISAKDQQRKSKEIKSLSYQYVNSIKLMGPDGTIPANFHKILESHFRRSGPE